MNLGMQLVKIRKEHKMSQEDFAEIFHVTRQTVSSWENSKSYPDIETIVKISDYFHLSLDILLKGDQEMILKISKEQKDNSKYKKIILSFSILFLFLFLAITIYFSLYFYKKDQLESNFLEVIAENNFYKNEEGSYTLSYQDNITYTVPNQKLPIQSGYDFHFFVQQIFCKISLDDHQVLNITWVDYDYFDAEVYDLDEKRMILDVGLLGKENIDPIIEITKKVDVDKELLESAIQKGNELYQEFYS